MTVSGEMTLIVTVEKWTLTQDLKQKPSKYGLTTMAIW